MPETVNEDHHGSACVERTLLLVDDEENIRRSLTRLLRREGYRIMTAASGKEGLQLLKDHEVGVIVSDQRMPQMTGTEFLSQVRKLYPDTVRIVLSGYSEFKTITSAINEGAIYKFLSKPWDDALLRTNIEEAFQYFELRRENERLSRELKAANSELLHVNQDLEQRVEEKTRDVMLNMRTLQIAQEVLESLSTVVLGIEDDGVIVVANRLARQLLGIDGKCLVGFPAEEVLPQPVVELYRRADEQEILKIENVKIDGLTSAGVYCYRMGQTSLAKGTIVVMTPKSIGEVSDAGGEK